MTEPSPEDIMFEYASERVAEDEQSAKAQQKKEKAADILIRLAGGAEELFHAPDGTGFATIASVIMLKRGRCAARASNVGWRENSLLRRRALRTPTPSSRRSTSSRRVHTLTADSGRCTSVSAHSMAACISTLPICDGVRLKSMAMAGEP